MALIPALIGWPLVVSFFAAIFGALFQFIAQFFTKRLLIVVTSITVLIALTTAFFLLIDGIISAVVISMPLEVGQYIGMWLPSNFSACVSALVTAHLARWAYDWKVRLVNMRMS